jgi:hypothetical protein
MKNQNRARFTLFGLRPFGGGLPPRDPTNVGLARGYAAASIGVRRSLGRVALRITATTVALAVLAFTAVVPLTAWATRGTSTEPVARPAAADIAVVVSFGPPAIPIYEQPPLPGPAFIWVPGYWAWDPDYGYFWVPGMWVQTPFEGALWTPGYWWWSDADDGFAWVPGYWGPVVGFYGGIAYGYGYTGDGFYGGYWRGGNYYYNRSVTNISSTTNITNVYNTTVVEKNVTRVSYNGGQGGTTARATSAQLAAAQQKRMVDTPEQTQQLQKARSDPKQQASVNRGRPAIAATQMPGKFSGAGAVPATREGAPYKAPNSTAAASPHGNTKVQPQAATPAPTPASPEEQPKAAKPNRSVRPTAQPPIPQPEATPPPSPREGPPPSAAPSGRPNKPGSPSGDKAVPQGGKPGQPGKQGKQQVDKKDKKEKPKKPGCGQ